MSGFFLKGDAESASDGTQRDWSNGEFADIQQARGHISGWQTSGFALLVENFCHNSP
jgi:hypothetical protein